MNTSLTMVDDLDETDLAILEQVETDFDVSLEAVADELDITKSAVYYRLNKLKDSGVIEGTTADVNPVSLGLEMVAITDVMVTHETGYSDEIGEKLRARPGVEQVYYTMGDTDFVVISRVQSREQLNDLIDRIIAIDGVNSTSSKFVLQEFESAYGVVENLTEEARDAVLEPTEE